MSGPYFIRVINSRIVDPCHDRCFVPEIERIVGHGLKQAIDTMDCFERRWAHYHFLVHVCCTTTCFMIKFLSFWFFSESLPLSSKQIRTWVFPYLPLWHVSGDPAIYYLFWAKCHPSKEFSQKKLWLETQNRLFSPHHQTTPFESFDSGATSLVLAGYRLVVLQPLCAFSTILYFCLLPFPHRFCHGRLVLFRLATCLFCPCLFSMEKDMGS